VLVLDLTAAEADLLLASLDPLAQMARASQEALAKLTSSAVLPRDLLQELCRRYPSEGRRGGLVDPDVIPPWPRTRRIWPGQLWALGAHRLACGDATDPAAISRLVGKAWIDVLWTDPPYGVSYVGKTPQALRIKNDDPAGLQALLENAFAAVDRALSPGARLYVCHPAGPASVIFAQAFSRAGWRLHQTLVWVKDRMVLGHADYHYRHEPILYGYRPGPGRWGRGHQGWYGGNEANSVLEVPRPAASRAHPTAKPVELIARCLANSSEPRDLVLDPFGGSGSTLVACEQLDRRAFLLELDPSYCEVAIRRWEEFTGEQAVRIDG
jgi:DNA modification methylase